MKTWKKSERDFVRQNYSSMPAEEIAKILGKTRASVSSMARRLGKDKILKLSKENDLYIEGISNGRGLSKTVNKCIDYLRLNNWSDKDEL